MYGVVSDGKPYDLLRGHAESLGEGGNLNLKIYQKSISAPPSNYLDDAVRLAGLMQGYGDAQAQGVRAILCGCNPSRSNQILSAQSRRRPTK